MIPEQFSVFMARCAPFETSPHIAVALSGGADSLALTLLAHEWATINGGRITALTVDHAIRESSSQESEQIAEWMSDHGIVHIILRADEPAPQSNIEAWARDLRYRLMTEWCREQHVLHLLTAHHQQDQIETFLLRIQRGSSPVGLACMPAVRLRNHVRILRPLLTENPAMLRSYLEACKQPWIEDESNDDQQFRRNAIRHALASSIPDEELTQHLQTTIQHAASTRRLSECAAASLLADSLQSLSKSSVTLALKPFIAGPREAQLRALQSCLRAIGHDAPIRHEKLVRLHESIIANKKATLGGCTIESRGNLLYISREHNTAKYAATLPLTSEYFGCEQP